MTFLAWSQCLQWQVFVYFDLSIFCFHFKKYSFGNHSVTKKKKRKEIQNILCTKTCLCNGLNILKKRIKTGGDKNLPARITKGSLDYICIFSYGKIKFFISLYHSDPCRSFSTRVSFNFLWRPNWHRKKGRLKKRKGKSSNERLLDFFHTFLFS